MRPATVLTLLGLGGLAATFAYVKLAPADRVPEAQLRTDSAAPAKNVPAATDRPIVESKSVRVLRPVYENDTLKFVKSDRSIKKDENPYLVAVNGFLEAAKVAPRDAVAKSATKSGNVLVIDFTTSFEQTYGTEDENTLLNGLRETAKQFPGVERIRITVDGHAIETLGNVDLTQDILVND